MIVQLSFSQIREYKKDEWQPKLDSLRELYGKNKTNINPKYELAILIALSFYPELKETHIDFNEEHIKTTMNAQPTVGSVLFRKKKNWRFTVNLNNKRKDSMVVVAELPFNALIGVFGHEFYHFVDYKTPKAGHFLNILFCYATVKGKKKVERRTDIGTIERGLGWQCWAFENYVQNHSKATMKYKQFKKKIYMSSDEIESYINSCPLYQK